MNHGDPMDSSTEPFKQGYLFGAPQGKLLKRSWQKKYYALYQASNLGVERVEVFETESQFVRHLSPNKLIPLNDCIKVVQAPQKHQSNVFEVICKNQIHQFSAETTQELAEWICAFQTVAFGSQRRESNPVIHISTVRDTRELESQQEENLIYSSMSKPEIYTVQIVESEASKRCGLSGIYQFVVTPLHISISPAGTSSKPSKALYTWHYRHIRRFSQTKGTFSFEAGRKCASGEGLFIFETKEGNAIFQSVGVYLKSYKKDSAVTCTQSSSDKSTSSSSSVPYSLSSANSSISLPPPENHKNGSNSVKPTFAEESLYENTVTGLGNLRPQISKPPRKSKTSSTTTKVSTSSEPTSPSVEALPIPSPSKVASDPNSPTTSEHNDAVFEIECKQMSNLAIVNPSEMLYDVPEERTDAWKTHGLETDNFHSENIPATADHGPMYASVDVTTMPPSKLPVLKSCQENTDHNVITDDGGIGDAGQND